MTSVWDEEFTSGHRRPIGSVFRLPVFVRAERRDTPLELEFGLTDRLALAARLPVVRTSVRARHLDTTAKLDSLLADPAYAISPVINTRRGLRYFAGDAELAIRNRVGPALAEFVLRLPTGHLDSPHDLFDVSTGDDQTDLELRLTYETTLARRLWLNVALRAAQQRPGTRERRVGPPTTALIPRAATAPLDWDPGDYAALDVAPMLRLATHLGVGVTAGYFTKRRDRYAYQSAQDSLDVAAALGTATPASVLNAGSAERRLRLGVALTYLGPEMEGGVSIERTVSASGARVPAATVFRLVMRTSRWPF